MLGLMGDDKKSGLASMIISQMDEGYDEAPMPEENYGDMVILNSFMKIKEAVKSGNDEMGAMALKEAIMHCMMKYGNSGGPKSIEMEF